MTPERFEELQRTLRDRLADFDFCGTILDDRFCDHVHPHAVGFALEAAAGLRGEEGREREGTTTQRGQKHPWHGSPFHQKQRDPSL